MISVLMVMFLWGVVAALAWVAAQMGQETLNKGLCEGIVDFIRLIPRLAIGIVGSGFLAALLPGDLVRAWLGPDSGLLGLLVATAAGAITPGGPVVGFAIGSTALKTGASLAAVVAYTTAWALFALQRLFIWELPAMPARVVWLRMVVSLPLPLLAAWSVLLVKS